MISESVSTTESDIESLIRSIYSTPNIKFSVQTTGGGIQVLSWLLTVPGGSNCIVEAGVPYAHGALQSFLGKLPEHSCSAAVALQIAKVAWRRTVALVLAESMHFSALRDNNIFSISCTAALVSAAPKAGPHRCFVGAASHDASVIVYGLNMTKGARSRVQEDAVCSRMILDCIARCISVTTLPQDFLIGCDGSPVTLKPEEPEIISIETRTQNTSMIDDLLTNKISSVLIVPKLPSGLIDQSLHHDFLFFDDINLPPGTIIFPGSFNPVHIGHVSSAMAAISLIQQRQQESQQPLVVFEISITNADKASLTPEEIFNRLKNFKLDNTLFANIGFTNFAISITAEPLFSGKSKIFRSCNFLIGADTMSRLLNKKYYGDSEHEMTAAFACIRERGCSFIVAGRAAAQHHVATFITAEDILLGEASATPTFIKEMFVGIRESSFRCDISSTEIRNLSKK